MVSEFPSSLKILFIVPGSGDSFYCGNCFRDSLHAGALRRAGHDVTVMPLYLPLAHESFKADTPLFFPAVSYYLARKLFGQNALPRAMERVLNSKFMLGLAASFSGSTSAKGLEDMTLSMITGDDGIFARYAGELIRGVACLDKPDVVHLSSSLLTGIAKALKRTMDIPIVCTLQDEELWINSLGETHAAAAWRGIADNLRYIDKFITSSNFYKNVILSKIPSIPAPEIVYPGVDLEKYAAGAPPENPTVGFFYRMNRENGLDILAEAFVKLKRRGSIENLKLKVGGGFSGKDKRFLKHVKRILNPYRHDAEMLSEYNLGEHPGFYRDISLACVPLRFDEGAGLYLCEAFAAGRPAVEPSTGSFDEILGNAGVLYSNNTPDVLADALETLFADKNLFQRCCNNAKRLAETRYNEKISAKQLYEIYTAIV
ncbi:MAG: glycosyltransferase family 4 protein [Prevotellaceae bacterium]|jgi:glycosyltransferase involved in cell wall biosynthesis|nr:glycosyltransferase family 4 protein [Prevotellaceae bacterium]